MVGWCSMGTFNDPWKSAVQLWTVWWKACRKVSKPKQRRKVQADPLKSKHLFHWQTDLFRYGQILLLFCKNLLLNSSPACAAFDGRAGGQVPRGALTTVSACDGYAKQSDDAFSFLGSSRRFHGKLADTRSERCGLGTSDEHGGSSAIDRRRDSR